MSETFGIMGRWADVMGLDAAVKFVSAFGGTRPYIRKSVPPMPDPIVEAITPAGYQALIDAGYTGQIQVPQCRAWLIVRRDEAIVLRHQAGEPVNDIAIAYKLSTRHVRNILRDAKCSQD